MSMGAPQQMPRMQARGIILDTLLMAITWTPASPFWHAWPYAAMRHALCGVKVFCCGLQVLASINGGSFGVGSKAIGLSLAPAADRIRSPPPPMLAQSRPNGSSRAPALGRGGRAQQAQGKGVPEEQASPAHRGGVDIGYLRMHDVRLG